MKTKQSAVGTSFHGITFVATVNDIIATLGEPTNNMNTGEDKTNFEWICETPQGNVFTIYDWKEYRPLLLDEPVEWHVGAHDRWTSDEAERYINRIF